MNRLGLLLHQQLFIDFPTLSATLDFRRRLWLPHTEMFLRDFNVFNQSYCFYLFRFLDI